MIIDDNFKKFLVSFSAWFNGELPDTKYIKDAYLDYDNWNGGTWSLNIDYRYIYKLRLGVENFQYNDIFDNPDCQIEDFKTFIELIYEECVDNRYKFTIEINNRLKTFNIPYKLQSGKFIREGHKGTERIEKIINYEMCERKIRFSEEMISSRELLDKKVALDYIVDSLQYLISITDGKCISDKYRKVALNIAGEDTNNSSCLVPLKRNPPSGWEQSKRTRMDGVA